MKKSFCRSSLAFMGLSMSWTIYADPVQLNIPASPLPQAIEQIAQSSGASIDYNGVQLPDYRVAALDGEYDVKTALTQVLGNSNNDSD